ncbi:MAG: hypothetical protein LIP08_00350 [Bacteroides sp.]|nr:hypothetical protein [Bacteroides sp.]
MQETGREVVGIHILGIIQFLHPVPIRLIRNRGTFAKQSTVRVVVVDLLDVAMRIGYHTDIALIVFQKVMVDRSGPAQGDITHFVKDHRQRAVVVKEVPTIVRHRRTVACRTDNTALDAVGCVHITK